MSEAYLIAAVQGNISSLSGHPHVEQVRPILQRLFEKSGVPARRVQELHWHGGDQEFWLNSLGTAFGFTQELARFQWPGTVLLAHWMLQSAARSIEAGDRDLVILAQETGDQVVALLLASPDAVGIYNLSPRARLGQKLTLSSAPGGLLAAASAVLEKADGSPADRSLADQEAVDQGSTEIQWVAAARQPEADSINASFRAARWLGSDKEVPPGDLFLLCALVGQLEEDKAQRGLLLSEGPQKSGLVTLVERV